MRIFVSHELKLDEKALIKALLHNTMIAFDTHKKAYNISPEAITFQFLILWWFC